MKELANFDKFINLAKDVTDPSKLAELNAQMINRMKDVASKVVGDEQRVIIDAGTESAQDYK